MTTNFIPFHQIPEWDDATEFTITGKQLRSIYDLFKAYTPFANSMEPILVDNLDNGKIKMRYEDTKGNPLSQEDIDQMYVKYVHDMVEKINEKRGD